MYEFLKVNLIENLALECKDGFKASLALTNGRLELAYPSEVCSVLEELRGFDDHCWTLSIEEVYRLVNSHGGMVDHPVNNMERLQSWGEELGS